MAEDDGAAGGATVGGLEPGDEAFGSVGRGFGAFKVHAAVSVQVAQAGEAVDDAAQAVVAAQAVAPAVRGVTVLQKYLKHRNKHQVGIRIFLLI